MKPELISKTISKDTIYNLTFSDIVFKFQCSRIGATYYDKPKGNAQFMFLCNPQKSGTSQVCIIFLHTIKKKLTKDIFHLLELIKILSFQYIFSVRNETLGFFNISKALPEHQQKLDFWHILGL